MIPLSVPNLAGNEWKYIKECLDTNWVSSVGSYVTLFEKNAAEFCGVKHAVATSNGTAALQISLLLAGVKRGDLVVLPNITFVAPANAIKYLGADPVLIDVNEDTWQMDLGVLADFLKHQTHIKTDGCYHAATNRKISALLPVHVLGNMCDMNSLKRLAADFLLTIVEDSTEAMGSYFEGRHAGGFGKFGTLSFNGNKIMTTGGGGMILTNDEDLAKMAKHLTTQAKAKADEYYHDEIGYNFRLVNILAAMGVAQLEQLPQFLKTKEKITTRYNQFFASVPDAKGQKITNGVHPNNWLYTVKVPRQKELREYLKGKHIEAQPFWVPMNRLPAFKNDTYVSNGDASSSVYHNCVSLPCSTGLTDQDQDIVIEAIANFYGG